MKFNCLFTYFVNYQLFMYYFVFLYSCLFLFCDQFQLLDVIFGKKMFTSVSLCRVFDGILDFKNVEFLTGIITYFKILWQWTFVNKIAKLTRTEFVDVDWLKVVDLADLELSFVMRKRHRYQITFNLFRQTVILIILWLYIAFDDILSNFPSNSNCFCFENLHNLLFYLLIT